MFIINVKKKGPNEKKPLSSVIDTSVVSHKGELALMNLSGSRISRCRLDGLNEVVFIPG